MCHNILLWYNFFYWTPVLNNLTNVFVKLCCLCSGKKQWLRSIWSWRTGLVYILLMCRLQKYQLGSIFHWLVSLVFVGWAHLKPILNSITRAKRSTLSTYFCSCADQHHAHHRWDWLSRQAASSCLHISAGCGMLAACSRKDLACGISRALLCSSDNGSMKVHNLFLPFIPCMSIFPPSRDPWF